MAYVRDKEKKKAYDKVYREANKKKLNAQKKAWYEANKDKIKARKKAYYEANKDETLAQQKEYREANKDKILAQQKAYREANKEKILAQKKAYREANKDKIKAYREANKDKIKAYCEANKDRFSVNYKAWALANYDKIREKNLLRRKLKNKLQRPSWYNSKLVNKIYNKCHKLNKIAGFIKYHVDHIVPLQGKNVSGLHVQGNLQIILASVNISKGNKFET